MSGKRAKALRQIARETAAEHRQLNLVEKFYKHLKRVWKRSRTLEV